MDNIGYVMPIIGGVIGYFTNWLAIKMIFRPYEEKYFLGKKLPFTPGLMAKERYALSNKIGKTVKKHVLTDDVIIDAIKDKDFSKIVNVIMDYLNNTEKTIGDIDEQLGGGLSGYINKFLFAAMEDGILKEKVATEISDKIKEFLNDEKNLDKVEEIGKKIFEKLQTETGELSISLKADTRTVEEVLRENNIERLKKVVEEMIPILIDQVRIFIEKNEGSELDREIGDLIKKIAIDSYGKIATALINPDKIYENGKINLNKYLKDNESKIILRSMELVDKLAEKEVKDVINKLPERAIKDIADGGKNILKEVVGKELNSNKIVSIINKTVPDINIRIKETVFKIINTLIRDNGEQIVEGIVNKTMSIEIKSIGAQLNDIDIDKLKITTENIIKELISKNGEEIINGFEIDKLVEDKINTMELEEMENIVLSVANKEIKSITVVGGVLGFIIGLVPLIGTLLQ